MLAGSGVIPRENLDRYFIMGELSLDGALRPIKGALPVAIQARKGQYKGFILPKANAREAAIVNDLEIYGVENLNEAIDILAGDSDILPLQVNTRDESATTWTIMLWIFQMCTDRKTSNAPWNLQQRAATTSS